MTEPLVTYLHDHLAGSRFAIELLQKMEAGYPDHETGHLASALLREIREDRAVLESIIDRVGSARPDFKDATAWLAELASRPKLRHDDPTGLGAFEAFEALGLGITWESCRSGKAWRSLPRRTLGLQVTISNTLPRGRGTSMIASTSTDWDLPKTRWWSKRREQKRTRDSSAYDPARSDSRESKASQTEVSSSDASGRPDVSRAAIP